MTCNSHERARQILGNLTGSDAQVEETLRECFHLYLSVKGERQRNNQTRGQHPFVSDDPHDPVDED